MSIRKRLVAVKKTAHVERRQPSRILSYPWPFPMTIDPVRGLVRNVQPRPDTPKEPENRESGPKTAK